MGTREVRNGPWPCMDTRMRDERLTARKAAEFLAGRFIGADKDITGVCALDDTRPGALAFAKSWEKVEAVGIKRVEECILLLPDTEVENAVLLPSVILVANPRLAFARLLAEYFQPHPSGVVAASSRIGRDVRIGTNVTIGEYCVIHDGAEIGDNTELRHHVVIGRNVRIGVSCLIKSHSVIGEEGFGIEKDENGLNIRVPHIGGVVIGDCVEIGALNTVCSGTVEPTVIGSHVKTDDHVHIGHNCRIGENTILTACAELSGSVTIGKDVWLAPNCSILNGLKIGDDAFVGLGAVVINNCEAGGLYAGSPARLLRRKSGV